MADTFLFLLQIKNNKMKKAITLFVFYLFTVPAFSQEIVNLMLVGEKGITEDIKEARSFIVIKQYPGGFQRLDYNMGAPLIRVKNYSDSLLKILHGAIYDYAPDGAITKSGYYANNLKEKTWFYFNDTGKVILEEIYEKGMLIKTINPDTLPKEPGTDNKKYDKVDKEAQYKKGDHDWIGYLSEALDPEVGNKSVNGGNVKVCFVVNTAGACVEIHLRKSVEFVLDEEAIRVIEKSPLWEPAIQNGRKVNAYRIQPIGFVKDEN
jgi:protein TonB